MSKTLKFLNNSTDTEARFNHNMKHNRDQMLELGWDKQEITYKMNEHGFRSEPFINQNGIMFLGCSHTLGVGLPLEQTFPYIVSQQLKTHYYNLGWSGGSHDTCFRHCTIWTPKLMPSLVVMLKPDIQRIEIIEHNTVYKIGSWYTDILRTNPLLLEWLDNPINSELNADKNEMAIRYYLNNLNIKLIMLDSKILVVRSASDAKQARDLLHYGPITQQLIADTILAQI